MSLGSTPTCNLDVRFELAFPFLLYGCWKKKMPKFLPSLVICAILSIWFHFPGGILLYCASIFFFEWILLRISNGEISQGRCEGWPSTRARYVLTTAGNEASSYPVSSNFMLQFQSHWSFHEFPTQQIPDLFRNGPAPSSRLLHLALFKELTPDLSNKTGRSRKKYWH